VLSDVSRRSGDSTAVSSSSVVPNICCTADLGSVSLSRPDESSNAVRPNVGGGVGGGGGMKTVGAHDVVSGGGGTVTGTIADDT